MGATWTRRVVALGVIAGVVSAAPPADATPKRRARVAVRFISSKQSSDGSLPAFSKVGSTADAVLSFVAARRGDRASKRALDYLSAQVQSPDSAAEAVDTVGERAKVILAAVAGGRDPRDFGGRNLVREIKDVRRPSGRYGRQTPVFDQALAILALDAATARRSRTAARWLAGAQCRDGGWQFDEPARRRDNRHCNDGSDDDFFKSDTNTTSYAVQALVVNQARLDRSPLRFFRRARDAAKGGWGYARNNLTDANSTALVLQAYAARERRHPRGALGALKALQYRRCGQNGGAFAFTYAPRPGGRLARSGRDLGATIGGVLGLLERPLPIAPFDISEPAPARRSCDG
jgi:hypothetical protein